MSVKVHLSTNIVFTDDQYALLETLWRKQSVWAEDIGVTPMSLEELLVTLIFDQIRWIRYQSPWMLDDDLQSVLHGDGEEEGDTRLQEPARLARDAGAAGME